MPSNYMNIKQSPQLQTIVDIADYVDTLYNLMGIDMDFGKFKLLNTEDRLQFVRDLKLKIIIDADSKS